MRITRARLMLGTTTARTVLRGISALCVLAVCCFAPEAFALDATLLHQKIAEHKVQKSDVLLFDSEADADDQMREKLQRFRYRLSDVVIPEGAGTYDGLPVCPEAQRRRQVVLRDSDELRKFDMLIYDYKDEQQRALAKRAQTPTVPYLEGDVYNPYRDKDNLQQNFARFFDVRCVPTRVHFVETSEGVFEEYLEGSAAWK